MCLSCGMTCFEMSHLFTQWGAGHPPKIMAEENGKEIKLFGWDDPAVGGRYTTFLEAYLPRLTEKLRELGIAGITRFHISDEPEPQHLLSYKQARESVAPYLKDFVIMDAISSIAVCRREKSTARCAPMTIWNHFWKQALRLCGAITVQPRIIWSATASWPCRPPDAVSMARRSLNTAWREFFTGDTIFIIPSTH